MNLKRLVTILLLVTPLLFALQGCSSSETPTETTAELVANVPYGYGGANQLYLDIIRPSRRPSSPMPVIVFIHGGGWVAGSKNEGHDFLRPYAERGYFCVSIDYNFTSYQLFPRQIKDAKCAIRYIRAHADYYGIDSSKIGVWGTSAGGHLAALLGTSGGASELEGHGGWAGYSSRVQAVCDWYGPTDFIAMVEQGPSIGRDIGSASSVESQLIGGAILENQDTARTASPVTYVTSDDPPFFIVHGRADDIVPFAQSEILVNALQKARVSVGFVPLEGAGHGGDAFKSSSVLDAVANFFSANLK